MPESFEKNINQEEKIDELLDSKLKLIESIGCGLGPKSMMALIVLGLKPATTLDLFKWNEDVESIKSKIGRAGLFFDDIYPPPFKNKERTANLAVACSQEIATDTAIFFRDPENHSQELGTYMGYPQTAIDAFMGKTKLLEDSEEVLKDKEWNRGIIGFAMSKDNSIEEIKVMEKWWEALKEKTPDLYKQILDNAGREEEDDY
jgi:hypothetical protein